MGGPLNCKFVLLLEVLTSELLSCHCIALASITKKLLTMRFFQFVSTSGWWVNRQRSTLRKVPRTNITKDVRQQQIELLTSIGFLWQVPAAGSGTYSSMTNASAGAAAARNVVVAAAAVQQQQGAGSSASAPAPAPASAHVAEADSVKKEQVDIKVEPDKEAMATADV
jgi:hypothetical protein